MPISFVELTTVHSNPAFCELVYEKKLSYLYKDEVSMECFLTKYLKNDRTSIKISRDSVGAFIHRDYSQSCEFSYAIFKI